MKIVPPQPTDLTYEEMHPAVYDYRPLDLHFDPPLDERIKEKKKINSKKVKNRKDRS